MNAWDIAAKTRKKQIESGEDITFSQVFFPIYNKIFQGLSHADVLEIGGGTGHLAKSIPFTNNITFIEPSKGMFSLAMELLSANSVTLVNDKFENYTSKNKYDIIFSHMCLQCIENINPLLAKVELLLKENGRFFFAIPHPCFFEEYKKFSAEGDYSYMQCKKYNFNLEIGKSKDIITSVTYYHRPISHYINSIINNKLEITAIKEIFPPKNIQDLYYAPWENPRYIFIEAKARHV